MAIVVKCTCGKRLRAPDAYAGKRVRCSNCSQVLVLATLPNIPPVVASDDEAAIYYLIEDSQAQGPFTRTDLKNGRLGPSSLVWRAGLSDWHRADQLTELHPLLTRLPPPVPMNAGSHPGRSDESPPLYDPKAFETLYSWFRISIIPGTIGCAVLTFIPNAFLIANLVYSLYLLVASVFYVVLLHKSWKQIQDGSVRTTPGKAVGLLFVPFFNLYWNFVAVDGLARDINRYAAERCLAIQPVSGTLARTYCVLGVVNFLAWWIPILGLFINIGQNLILLFLLHQVKDASVLIATAKLVGKGARTVPCAN